MKTAITLLILLTVIISMYEPGQPIGCPQPPQKVTLNTDGSYSRSSQMTMTLQACFSSSRTWKEEWTDYPEKGGTFIRKVSE